MTQIHLPGLSAADAQALLDAGESAAFAADDVLLAQGDPVTHLLILTDGVADVMQGGRLMARLDVGDVVGEMGLLAEVPARASMVARTEGTVLRVGLDGLRDSELAARLRAALGRLAVDRLRARRHTPLEVDAATGQAWTEAQGALAHLIRSPAIAVFAQRYEQRALRKGRFLWGWAARGVDATTLACVPADAVDDMRDTKLLALILHVLLDDLVDTGDEARVERALAIPLRGPNAAPLSGVSVDDAPYFQLVADVWDTLWGRIKGLPGFKIYRQQLLFDYQQVFTAMRYGLLAHQSAARLNTAEQRQYLPHTMHMMVFATLDLMASVDFDAAELGRLRHAMWHAQNMGLLAKMVVTWRREVPEGDFTSCVVVKAMARGVLTLADLDLPPDELVQRIEASDVLDRLLDDWLDHRQRLMAAAATLESVDIGRLVGGLEAVLGMTLSTRGLL